MGEIIKNVLMAIDYLAGHERGPDANETSQRHTFCRLAIVQAVCDRI